MVTYIYFVKCPNCEDEHFDFFDEAKEYALGCLSKKPIITQTEVCRNDFGECTDHSDLGTIWSWEDMMEKSESEDTVFSKAETFGISEGIDDFDDFDIGPQVDEFDLYDEIDQDELEPVKEDYELSSTTKTTKDQLYDYIVTQGQIVTLNLGDQGEMGVRFSDGSRYSDTELSITFNSKGRLYSEDTFSAWETFYSDDGDLTDGDYSFETTSFDELWDELLDRAPEFFTNKADSRNPVPEGMTIEQLQEEMEDNEDTVECSKCGNLVEKTNCHHNQEGFGWCCNTCEPAELHDLGNTYDGGYPEEDLIEAFKYLPLIPNAKEKIVDELKQMPIVSRFVSGDTITVDLYTRSSSASGYSRTGKVVDFIISGENIEISYEKNGHLYFVELDTALAGNDMWFGRLVRNMPTYTVLKAIKDIATKLNRENKSVTGIRDHRAVVTLTPEIAKELKAHIRNIRFKIPRFNNYAGSDFIAAEPLDRDHFFSSNPDAEALDKAADQVAGHLSNIHNSFMALPFAKDAIAAGMVSYRDPINYKDPKYPGGLLVDTFEDYKSQWGIACIIYFESGWTIDKFSEDTKKYLEDMKVDSKQTNKAELEDKTDASKATDTSGADTAKNSKSKKEPKIPNSVSGIRTAKALIKYFNNDVRFFEKKSTVTESSLSDILRNANDEYGTNYTERDFIDSEGFEDAGAFDDFESPRRAFAEIQNRKRAKQAYAVNKAKAAKNQDNPFDIDFPEV